MTPATRQPVGVINPALVASRENALLEVLRRSPAGLLTAEICGAVEEPPLATVDRLRRLLRRGEVEKVGREWGLPRDDADDVDVAESEPEPEPEDPSRWIRSINRYLRQLAPSPFTLCRYG